MTTSVPPTSDRGGGASTSSPAGFLVNLSRVLVKGEEQATTVTSGRRCSGLLERYNPGMWWARTLLESSAWFSPLRALLWKAAPMRAYQTGPAGSTSCTGCASTSKGRATTCSRLLFQLLPRVRRTSASGCGSLLSGATTEPEAPQAERETVQELDNPLPSPLTKMRDIAAQDKTFVLRGRTLYRPTTGKHAATTIDRVANRGWLPMPEQPRDLVQEMGGWLLPTPIGTEGALQTTNVHWHYEGSRPVRDTTGKAMIRSLGALAQKGKLPSPKGFLYDLPDNPIDRLSIPYLAEMMHFPPLWTIYPFLKDGGTIKVFVDSATRGV